MGEVLNHRSSKFLAKQKRQMTEISIALTIFYRNTWTSDRSEVQLMSNSSFLETDHLSE